jgi:hypothetical protein
MIADCGMRPPLKKQIGFNKVNKVVRAIQVNSALRSAAEQRRLLPVVSRHFLPMFLTITASAV